uniref:Uncharacterized protein n=1 Tax=Corvus moneduloides TaxID=1196302 RepID=A0A8C3D941_CORMO
MGALQPGLPNPAMLPQNWPLLIIDLKDCFFTIPLHPDDTKRFAFTLPALNKGEPARRFEWTVLPQGMKNSPTLCQLYVDAALQPLRRQMPDAIIYHYMDNILFAQRDPFTPAQMQIIVASLAAWSLVVAPNKIQVSAPWKYLGWTITAQRIKPQKLHIQASISNLNEAQKLLGDLQWLKPVTGIPNMLLEQLRPLLKGTDPCTPVTLTPQQSKVLQQITSCISRGFVDRLDPDTPLSLTVWNSGEHLLGAITQQKKTGDISVLEWISPPLQQRKTVTPKIENLATLLKKGRLRTWEISGLEPAVINLPMEKPTLDWYLLNSSRLTEALLSSGAEVRTGPLAPKSLNWLGSWTWISKPLQHQGPIPDALTVFTDAGRRTRTAAVVWHYNQQWCHHKIAATPTDTLQTLELVAVLWAALHFLEPLNVVSDSLYVVGIVSRIEDAVIKEVKKQRLFDLLLQLKRALRNRSHPYAILHIRSHKWQEGLGEGNERADQIVSLSQNVPKNTRARESHSMFHQNAKGLVRDFHIPLRDARAIVKACPLCSFHNTGVGLGIGVNPRGLKANEIWQMDVTHVPSFGRLKYVHVSIDTYSHFIWATAQTGEQARHVERHLNSCIAVMGVPLIIKTDNGPAYSSARFDRYMQNWNIIHKTGIPHSPTGQAIVERAHGTLKTYLQKYPDLSNPHDKLQKCLFVLNHLCVFGDKEVPPAIVHFTYPQPPTPMPWVRYKDPKTGLWQDPVKTLYWGRGYLCVSTPTGPLWVPAKWTKPVVTDEQPTTEEGEKSTEEDLTNPAGS